MGVFLFLSVISYSSSMKRELAKAIEPSFSSYVKIQSIKLLEYHNHNKHKDCHQKIQILQNTIERDTNSFF